MFFEIPRIDEDRSYWLVRTKGGKLYNDFYEGNFISIGWDKINKLDANEEKAIEQVKSEYPKESRPKLAVTQINRFLKEMQIGDVVIIPSKGSSNISFGIIKEDVEIKHQVVEKEGVLNKRRKVEWVKTIKREKLDSNLFPLFNSHHTITDATKLYAEYIDRTLHSIYIKGDIAHLVLEVTKSTGIHANAFFPLGNTILDILQDYNSITNAGLNLNELEVKVNVQSPGKLALLGGIGLIGALSALIVAFSGGGFEAQGMKFQTEGASKSITYFLDHWQERQQKQAIFNKYMEKMEIKTPDELDKAIKAVGNVEDKNSDTEQKEKQVDKPADSDQK